ncbi:MAG TPA: TonB-dependent receptor [Vicinamibacteria bacterium]|nr:TonB-dependent receptor [Vicinamibacteria bacterium]
MTRRALSAAVVFLLAAAAPLLAQSQAINGTIEGSVRDTTGGAVPGATVTVTSVDTGALRVLQTNEEGFYRAPLLPLGTYRVKAELAGFKTVERTGLTLSAGQTAVIDFTMAVGGVEEVVSVTGESPVAEPGRIDLGRTIGEAEVRNLPLVSRNPYNFAFLQPNVTGFENEEFGVPRINANGTQMHTNYQIDGNTNTEKDRAGLRLLPASEIMVREVKVITSGFAPEFGQTTGMVYNVVTPSGTNDFRGSASYRFRRKAMSEKPFFLAPTAPKPDTYVNNYTATLGGPIAKDKWFFYAGYEYVDRDLSADRVIGVTQAQATQLGLPAAALGDGVIPATQAVHFFLGKTDYQLAPEHKLSARYFFFKNHSPFNIGTASGGVNNTIEQATDFNDRMDSVSAQLISSFGAEKLNELRVQYARRHQFRTASEGSGTGPAIRVSGVANFGGPIAGVSDAGFDFNQEIWQLIDNFTWLRGRHSFKAGFDVQKIDDFRRNVLFQLYTFPNAQAYLDARSGTNRRSYTNFQQLIGDPEVAYDSTFLSFFVQDDLRVTPRLKVLFGLRYDLFQVPEARPFGANPHSREFRVDRNNIGPRVGLAWTLDADARTVLRASTGVMYEPPLLNFYEDAIQRNGDPRTLTVTVNPTTAGAPDFPNTLADLPPGFVRPVQSIVTIDPDFSSQYTILSNVQLERALTSDLAVAVGLVNGLHRNMPVLVDTNLIPTGQALADGRPVYATAVNAQTRVDPTFNHVDTFQSIGEGTYNAVTFTVNKRMSHGFQAQASYTLARGEDNAPLTGTYAVGSGDDRLSDPSDIGRDEGVTPFNQTHTFVLSTLIAPRVAGDGLGAALVNNNQLGIIVQANSGLPFNVRANRDLNLDGVTSDRPIGIERNSGRLGRVLNVDARFVRFVPVGRARAELFVEAKNVFNTENVATINRVVAVDAAGNPTVDLGALRKTAGYLPRNIQAGLKVTF